MHILVIDDDIVFARAIAGCLRDGGDACDLIFNAAEALYRSATQRYDAILLGLDLEKSDCLALLGDLSRALCDEWVFVLTRSPDPALRVELLDAGADGCLTKPLEPVELRLRVRALIRRSTRHAADIRETGEVRLDLRARMVSRAGRPVALTPSEYELLCVLVSKRGEVVSREDAYGQLSPGGSPSRSNVVEVHVAGIRRKLGRELIETRRGAGYIVGV